MASRHYPVVTAARWMSLAVFLGALLGGIASAGCGDPLEGKRVTLDLQSADLIDVAGVLNDQLRLPVCFEGIDPVAREDKPARFTVRIQDVSAREALDAVTRVAGTHVWRVSAEPFTINLVPRDLLNNPNWALNRRCPEFKVEDVSIWDAVRTASQKAGLEGGNRIYSGVLASISPPPGVELHDFWLYKFYQRRITLAVKAGTLREVLNQIASAIGDAWYVYGEKRGEEGTCVKMAYFYPIAPNVLSQHEPSVPPAE